MKRIRAVQHLVLVACLAGLNAVSTLANADESEVNHLVLPSGQYIVTAVRRANRVESTADAEPNIAELIGSTAQFDDILIWIDGSSCEGWTGVASRNVTLNLHNPVLSDLTIEKLEPPAHETFAIAQTMDVFCDRANVAPVANVTTIDDRVLVTDSPAGTYHILLEKPLNREELQRLQVQLQGMKFFNGEISGEMDEATRAAVSAYAEYRGAEYRFKNAVITRNLLDGLDILDER